jgi:hypothetical protein
MEKRSTRSRYSSCFLFFPVPGPSPRRHSTIDVKARGKKEGENIK